MKVLIWPVTSITTHHKKAKSIVSDELERMGIGHKIWWSVMGYLSQAEEEEMKERFYPLKLTGIALPKSRLSR